MDLHELPPAAIASYPDPTMSDFDYAAFLSASQPPSHPHHQPTQAHHQHPYPHHPSHLAPHHQHHPQQQQQQHQHHQHHQHHPSHHHPLDATSLAHAYPIAPALTHPGPVPSTTPPTAPIPLYSDANRVGTSPSSDNNVRASSVGSGELTRLSGTGSVTAKQRLERRGHTKSRRGCYNCKRRRIKCQETRPACGHCVKTGLKCEYPSMPQITHQPHHQIPLFSLQDMRFFQHFLTQCYPHHPLGQEEIWTHDIPCIAHNHEFLMHAILGFAASELITTDPSLVNAAMAHRIKAVKAIKKRLSEASKMSTTYEEANALVATCFALTFQSVSLDDGLPEYMTFIRGIVIVAMQMMFRNITPMFENLTGPDQEEVLAPLMENLPLIQRGWADGANDAVHSLRPLCVETVEMEYLEKLVNIVDKLYINSFDAYKANSQQYGWWMLLPHSSFSELLSQDNQVMLLLHTHWIALSQIMTFISQNEHGARAKQPSRASTPDQQADAAQNPGFQRWLRHLNSKIDYEHQPYNQWPMWVAAQLEKDPTFFGKSLASG